MAASVAYPWGNAGAKDARLSSRVSPSAAAVRGTCPSVHRCSSPSAAADDEAEPGAPAGGSSGTVISSTKTSGLCGSSSGGSFFPESSRSCTSSCSSPEGRKGDSGRRKRRQNLVVFLLSCLSSPWPQHWRCRYLLLLFWALLLLFCWATCWLLLQQRVSGVPAYWRLLQRQQQETALTSGASLWKSFFSYIWDAAKEDEMEIAAAGAPPSAHAVFFNIPRRQRQRISLGVSGDRYADAPALLIEPELINEVNPGIEEDRLHGRVGLLRDGTPAWTPTPLVFKLTAEQKRDAHAGYCFNTRVADALSLDRKTPDFASPNCRMQRKFFDAFTAPHPTPPLQQQQDQLQEEQQHQQQQQQHEEEPQRLREERQQQPHEQQEQQHHQRLQQQQHYQYHQRLQKQHQQQQQQPGLKSAAEGAAAAQDEADLREDGYLPNTSVVIIFHNENLSVLLRTAHSVLNRTPASLLKEIILVDDYSDTTTHPWLGQQLEDYVAGTLPKTRLLRLLQRRGLMGARTAGASVARGETITFLDSHVECLPFWLQPLLFHVRQNWRNVAVPEISSIHHDTFDIRQGGLSALGFTWGLAHHHLNDKQRRHLEATRKRKEKVKNETRGDEGEKEEREEKKEKGRIGGEGGRGGGEEEEEEEEGEATDPDAPLASPIMAGGIFTISRRWWEMLEGYDKEMEIYGGEEFELSFKIWMCGGQLHVIPCSKVAHLFRSSEFWQGQVYPVPGETVARNKLRVAAVWMGGRYEQLVQLVQPPLAAAGVGDVSKQLLLKKKLGCQSFAWYLREIYPELLLPPFWIDAAALAGAIKNRKYHCCLDTLTTRGEIIGAYPCHYQHGTQAFLYSRVGHRLVVAEHNFEECVWGDAAAKTLPERPCSRNSSSSNSSGSSEDSAVGLTEVRQQLESQQDDGSSYDKQQKNSNRNSSRASAAEMLQKTLQHYLPATANESEENMSEFWFYDETSQQLQLMHPPHSEGELRLQQLCMEVTDEATEKSPFTLLLRPCEAHNLAQKFVFLP